MSAVKKNKKTASKKPFGIIDPNVGNYEKHPFFIKKATRAKALVEKVGLPEEFYAQTRSRKKSS